MALNRDFNPFSNAEVRIVETEVETLRRLSRSQGADDPGKRTLEDVPFERYVDVWLAAMALGVANDAHTPVENLERKRFIWGNVFQHDLDSIELLFLVAIARTGDPYVVGDVRAVLDIAEGYATGGLPILVEMTNSGNLSPVRNLARSLRGSLTLPDAVD
jgi:hypothetical protein